MKKDTMTLKPGILVSLKTSMRGGVKYERKELDVAEGAAATAIETGADGEETEVETGASVEKWETTKIIDDFDEYKAATKARSKCGALIRAVCSHSAFGLICPESKAKELDEAIAEAKAMAAKHNARPGATTQIAVYALKGRIASTDEEAAKAIASELRDLLDDMKEGVAAGNVKAARDAADKARQMGSMLDERTASKVKKAIDEVRAAAKDIVKKMSEGVSAAEVVKTIKLEAVATARYAFIDMEDSAKVEELPMVAARDADVEELPTEGSESGNLGADGPDPLESLPSYRSAPELDA